MGCHTEASAGEDGSVGQIDANECGGGFGENRVIGAGVEETGQELRIRWSDERDADWKLEEMPFCMRFCMQLIGSWKKMG
jgi:hypothetical protein